MSRADFGKVQVVPQMRHGFGNFAYCVAQPSLFRSIRNSVLGAVAVVAFAVDRVIARRQVPPMSARAVPFRPANDPVLYRAMTLFCGACWPCARSRRWCGSGPTTCL